MVNNNNKKILKFKLVIEYICGLNRYFKVKCCLYCHDLCCAYKSS